ncbi:MAG: hypothetical protein PHF23_01250 [Smithellaceae bacterium]|jgi:hypothetical protein|nr:hypothetical protein [Smithellaceae bacterium]
MKNFIRIGFWLMLFVSLRDAQTRPKAYENAMMEELTVISFE